MEKKKITITATVAVIAPDMDEAEYLYGMRFVDINTIKDCDAIILMVDHEQF